MLKALKRVILTGYERFTKEPEAKQFGVIFFLGTVVSPLSN
jgi:hypothetical protein